MKHQFTIKEILADHWDAFSKAYSGSLRPVVENEVQKVLGCGELKGGFSFYVCPDCGRYKFVPFRCHSRFCNTCGIKYQQSRAESIANKLINCRHRHAVFTIPEELRIYFRKDRRLLNILFQSAAQTIADWSYNQNKSKGFRFGMVCGLHTFGRDLKWNPHIHMIISEGCYSISHDEWKNVNYIPFVMLRKRWMTTLLSNMKNSLDPNIFDIDQFKALVSSFYKNHCEGFYVHAPKSELNSTTVIVNYVTRYIGRPVMAQSRITNYDGSNVSYWYQRHEDNELVHVTEGAFAFIKKLIIHIPEKGFNMLRYYGLYADGPDAYPVLNRRTPKEKHHTNRLKLSWQMNIALSFGYDPLKCSCGGSMVLTDIVQANGPPISGKPWYNILNRKQGGKVFIWLS